jgi:hypothetical protein
MERLRLGTVGLGLLAPVSLLLAATPNTAEIDNFVKQLGHEKFAQREAAKHALEDIGAPALDFLRRACTSDDPEIQRRARELVRSIEKRVERDLVLQPTRLQLSFKDMPVSEALAEIVKRSGYSILLGGDATVLANRRLTLETGDVSFWEALDLFCNKAELTQQPASTALQRGVPLSLPGANPARLQGRSNLLRNSSIVLIPGKPPLYPTYYAGALRLRLLPSGAAGQAFTPGPGEVVMTLEVSPEPKLQGQDQLSVHVTQALDDKNQQIAQVVPPASSRNTEQQVIIQNGNQVIIRQVIVARSNFNPMESAGWNGASQTVPVRLKLPEKAGQTLAALKATLSAQIQTPLQPLLTIDDINKAGNGRIQGKDGSELQVLSVGADRGDVELRLQVFPRSPQVGAGINIPIQMLPNGPAVPLAGFRTSASNSGTQFTLHDAEGQPYQLIATRVNETINQNSYALVYLLTFRPAKPGAEPRKLTYAASRLASIEVPFAMKNVPLSEGPQ